MTRRGEGAAVFLLSLLAFTICLGDMALWSRDETTYAEIARQIGLTGDWLTLRYLGDPWFCHPPLFFWMMALAGRLPEVPEVTMRLPAALFGAAGVWLSWIWGRTLFSPRAAWLAAIAMALNVQYFAQSRLAILDTTFLFFLSLSMLGFWHATRGQPSGWWVMFGSAGLACLAKGPYGLLFPFVVAVPYLLVSRRLSILRDAPWLRGGLLALALGGAWYVAEALVHGRAFIDPVFGKFFIGRLTTEVMDQGGPFWFYIPVLLLGFFPWSFFLPTAMAWLWGQARRPVPARERALFLLTWILVPFIGLSLARTKLPNYIFFVYPAVVLAVAGWLDEGIAPDRVRRLLMRPVAGVLLFAAVLLVGLAVVAQPRLPDLGPDLRLVGLAWMPVLLSALAAYWILFRPGPLSPHAAPVLLAAGMAGFLLSGVFFLQARIDAHRPVHRLIARERASLAGAPQVACLDEDLYGLQYYVQRPVTPLVDASQVSVFLSASAGSLVVLPTDTARTLSLEGRARIVGTDGGTALVGNP